MSIANSIIAAMEDTVQDEFEALRPIIKSEKSLKKADFAKLIKLVREQPLEILAKEDLTVKEYTIIGKAMTLSKLQNTSEIIEFLVFKQNKKAALLLNCILSKKCKINTQPVEEYLIQMIQGETQLCHLSLLLTISKNYPNLINSAILEFCERKEHPICKEIIKRHKMECEL